MSILPLFDFNSLWTFPGMGECGLRKPGLPELAELGISDKFFEFPDQAKVKLVLNVR